MRGRFVTFEGGDGAGKTTQIALAAAFLRARGIDVVETREPGGSPGAEAVRAFILSGKAKHLGRDTETLLFAAARIDHIDTIIRPALFAGKWVLSDRFVDSTRAYQGARLDCAGSDDAPDTEGVITQERLQGEFVDLLERIAVADLMPDRTYLIDLSPAESARRIAARRQDSVVPDRFDGEGDRVHRMRREIYLACAARDAQRIVVIDGTHRVAQVHDTITRDLERVFRSFFPVQAGRDAGHEAMPGADEMAGAARPAHHPGNQNTGDARAVSEPAAPQSELRQADVV